MQALLEVLGALVVSYILSYFPWRFLYGPKVPHVRGHREVRAWTRGPTNWKDG